MSSFTSSSKNHHEYESTSTTTKPKRERYHVYLSFCAKDTDSFVSCLLEAFSSHPNQRGMPNIFLGFDKIGDEDRVITPSELNVIEEFRFAIIIFSKNYANSRLCLQELEKITECCRTTDGLNVLPFFYHGFYPSCGRLTSSMFGEAFHNFLDRTTIKEISKEEDKFMSWVAAISTTTEKASKFPGSVEPQFKHWSQIEHIDDIVNCVGFAIIKPFSRYYFPYTASLNSVVQDVIQLLKQSKSPLLLGIWGMEGIGKSVIAKAIYHQIGPYFEGMCFLHNVGYFWGKNDGQLSLHQSLYHNIIKRNKTRFKNKQRKRYIDTTKKKKLTTESEKKILKESLQHRRVLLVLDGVDKLEQLKALCGSREWFGAGSKIIIITRDRHLLKEHRVDHIYRVKELDESDSLEIFYSYIPDAKIALEDFAELSRQVLSYCRGWPLALRHLGAFLSNKEAHEWRGALRSLERFSIPDPSLLETLEKSFRDLSNKEKHIFLDISSFFIGKNKNDVLQMLNRSTQSAAYQISLLEDKSLITTDKNNRLEMHAILQAMAGDIIRKESGYMTKHQPKMYDVFLSFRGDDSRVKFISHLYSSLQNAGIYVFRDDDEIQQGDQISTTLLQAIGRCRISIVVLTKNYANSKWCMLELEKIMEVGMTRGLVVVPVFYEVDPKEVRHQKGQFGKAFEDLLSTTSVDESTKSNWRRELLHIGGIAGFVLAGSRNEYEDIKGIVDHVTRLLDREELFVAEHPVGVKSRVQAATKLLNIQNSEDVLLLGIWGMGGTGKTTIAKAIYNKIGSEFEGRSFLLNIREYWESHTNQVSLQQQVLCDVYKTTTFKIRDIESGKNILKERLSQSRVLLVLDDVNALDQIKDLCGSREWFGPGSRIIITTRDRNLLELCGVDEVYTIEGMDESESLELFSWHAFKQPSPTKAFASHSADVIAYSGRLPLALEVLGSCLSNCEIKEWQKVLEKIRCIPHDEVHKKLKVSFDGLKDVTEKQIFLDIACFFIGVDQCDVIQILNGCGFFADSGMKVLVERSLITVDNRNKLRMHDLLRDMGRQIVYEESPFDPENRSRLWRHEEVFDILSNYKGTGAVKGLTLEFPIKNTVCLNTKAFKKMNKLRLLQLSGVQLNGDFKHLSGDLRWLYLHGIKFPSSYAPGKFQQGSLVALKLKYSNVKQLWKKNQMLENLKILNLSHSVDLTETPDFSYMPNLEKLVLKDCPSLSAVSDSIGSLHKLVLINLTDCTGLRTLPRTIYQLKSLETFILSGCSLIDKLEEDVEQMESLTTLIAKKTAIKKVPISIVRLKSIVYISLSGCEGLPRDVFPYVIRSRMSPTNNVISLVQRSASMPSIVLLELIKHRSLYVECVSDLQLTHVVAMILDVLKATNCKNLEASASSSTSQISDMQTSPLIDDCLGQDRNPESKNDLKYLLIQMGTKCQVSNTAEYSVLQTADGTWDSFLLLCDDKSDTFSCKGCSIIFDVPATKGRNLNSMRLSVVYYSSSENITSEGCQCVLIINYTKTTIQAYKRDTLISFEDEDWQSITSNLEPGNKVGVMVVFGEGVIVDKTIVSLLYDEPVDKEMESCHAVNEEDVIVSGNDDNNVSVSYGDNEAINHFGEETVNHMQIIRHGGGLYTDAVGPLQPVPCDPDQPAQAVAEEIPAAEAYGDQEQQVPPPEQQETAAPEAIGSALGAQILDALRELRADFFQLEQTVTARFDAVEVRLEVLEDVMTQIPRGSNSESTDV